MYDLPVPGVFGLVAAFCPDRPIGMSPFGVKLTANGSFQEIPSMSLAGQMLPVES